MEYTENYLYGVSLVVAAVLNMALAGMLWFDSNNYIYDETPRYQRARRLTGLSLLVFGLGFLLHWLFMPHFNNLLMGKALSFSYFHIGGVLFSMSHTGLIDRHYMDRRVVVRDVTVLVLSLAVYWANAFIGNTVLTYLGSGLFFLHIGYLTWVFYSRFHRIYHQLGRFADYMPNDSDHEVLWLHYSCHLIISFGIGGMLCTVVFHNKTLPFTLLLLVGVPVFCYIYKALDSFGAVATEVEGNLQESEELESPADPPCPTLQSEGEINVPQKNENENENENPTPNDNVDDEMRRRIERWIAERHYTNPKLTLKDTLEQIDITENTLNYYLEQHTAHKGYRQWVSYLRIEEVKRQMCQNPYFSLQAVAVLCGYANASSLSRAFKAQEGISPNDWHSKNRGDSAQEIQT